MSGAAARTPYPPGDLVPARAQIATKPDGRSPITPGPDYVPRCGKGLARDHGER